MSRSLADQLLRSTVRAWNVYGPTETTVWCTIAQLENGTADPPIGRPLPNYNAYVLDSEMRLLELGVAGELWIGGAGVARGYRNRPELTAGSFVPTKLAASSKTNLRDRFICSSGGAIAPRQRLTFPLFLANGRC